MTRPMILVGCWPRRMCAELGATYCGEPNTAAFLKRVGREYPQPRVNDGRRRLWLRDDLDQAIVPLRTDGRTGRGRGFVMLAKPLPRFVIAKPLVRGRTGFYFTVPTYYRKQGCKISNESLGFRL